MDHSFGTGEPFSLGVEEELFVVVIARLRAGYPRLMSPEEATT